MTILRSTILAQVRRLRSAVQPQGSSRNAVEPSSECVFWMEYLHVSPDSNSIANRLRSSSYVDPPSFSVQLTADTHHPESVLGSVPQSVLAGRPAVGRRAQAFIVNGNLRLQLVLTHKNTVCSMRLAVARPKLHHDSFSRYRQPRPQHCTRID